MKNSPWLSVSKVINAVPRGETRRGHDGDANTRTGRREVESTPKLMGVYGRDERDDNERRLVEFATSGRLSILDTLYAHPNAGHHTFRSSNRGKGEYRLLSYPNPPGGHAIDTQRLYGASAIGLRPQPCVSKRPPPWPSGLGLTRERKTKQKYPPPGLTYSGWWRTPNSGTA